MLPLSEKIAARGSAAELFIAERTASNHVSNILAGTKCGNRTEAAAFAHRHGLVKP